MLALFCSHSAPLRRPTRRPRFEPWPIRCAARAILRDSSTTPTLAPGMASVASGAIPRVTDRAGARTIGRRSYPRGLQSALRVRALTAPPTFVTFAASTEILSNSALGCTIGEVSVSLSDIEVSAVWRYVVQAGRPVVKQFDRLDLRLSATKCALAMQMRNASDLSRWLRSLDLPQFEPLKEWYYLDTMHARATALGSLTALSRQLDCYPSILCRFLLRVEGAGWRAIQSHPRDVIRRRAAEVWCTQRETLLGRSAALWEPPSPDGFSELT